MEKEKGHTREKVKTGKIKSVIVELDGKVLTDEEKKDYVCVSKTVREIIDEVYERMQSQKDK